MKNTATRLLVATVSMLAVAAVASADWMQYDGMGLYETVKLHAAGSPANNQNVYAGQIMITYQDEQYAAFCVDIYEPAQSAEMTELSVTSLNNAAMVAYLFDQYATGLTSTRDSAVLQVAIWEVINERSQNFDVFSGSFHVRNNNDVISRANEMLAGLPTTYTPANGMMVLHSNGAQDLLIYKGGQIPEPSTLAVLGLGAAGLIWRRRLT